MNTETVEEYAGGLQMIDMKFRKLMIECPEIVRRAVLTDQEITFVKHVQLYGPLTTPDLVAVFCKSTQHTSGILKALHRKGYLKRLQVNDPSGGKMYEYSATFDTCTVEGARATS